MKLRGELFRISFLTVLLMGSALYLYGQQTIKQVSITMGSPEATELAKYSNLDVSMYKGVPNVTVPIYTVQLKDFELPVYLSYDAGGVKVDQIATSVGLGWSLMAGGQITAASYTLSDFQYDPDRPDNLQTFNPNLWDPNFGTPQQREDYEFAWEIFNSSFGGVAKNLKPDIFYVQYPGYSGKFVLSSGSLRYGSGGKRSIPYENHSISFTYNNGLDNYFTITDDRGNAFIFGELEITTTSTLCSVGVGSQFGSGQPISSYMIPQRAYTWHLTKIITANNDTITFTYQSQEAYSYESKKTQQKYKSYSNPFACPDDTGSDLNCTVTKSVSPPLLTNIQHSRSNLEIIFEYGGVRQDFGGGNFEMLQGISIEKNGNSIKNYTLTHNYFTTGGGSGERYKRLKLESVQQTGLPATTFEYDPGPFTHRGSYAQDAWGFYNGQGSNQTLVPETGGLTNAANRNVYTQYVGGWSMTEINYPSGGATVLDMEADPAGGGLRVKTIKDVNGMGKTTGERHFSYERVTYNAPVFVDSYYYWAYSSGSSNPVQCSYTMVTANTTLPVAAMDGADYGYKKVTVDYLTGGQKGRMIARYSTQYNNNNNAIGWGRGQLLSKTFYRYSGGSFSQVKKVVNTYKDTYTNAPMWDNPSGAHEDYIYGLDIQLRWPEAQNGVQLDEPARFDVTKYRIVSAWKHRDLTYVYLYDPDGSTSRKVVTTTRQIFNTSSTRLEEVHNTNSDGAKRITTYVYAAGEYPGFDKPGRLYSVTVSDGAGNDLSKRWATWANNLGSGRWERSGIWDWTGTDGSAPPGPTSEAVRVQNITQYDNYGNVLKLTDANGAVNRFYYGSNSSPLSQNGLFGTLGVYLTGIRKEGSPDLITRGYYDNKGRLTRVNDPAGVNTRYEYDSVNRLQRIRNDANQTVNYFDYALRGQAISPTNPNWTRIRSYPGGTVRYRTTYIDGLGRPVQTQVRTGASDIISAITYDDQGREHQSWRPYKRDVNHQYDANFAAHAQSYYGNTYPFLETLYDASPLNRPDKSIPPGGQSSSGFVDKRYDVVPWQGDNYLRTTITDENGQKTLVWTDGWGRTVRTVADPGGIAAETVFEYDISGNLVQVTAPNGPVTTYQYNTRRLLSQKTTPDAGTVKYKYDKAGNLRFVQDAVQAAAGRVVYYSYDEHGRKVLEGNWSANFNNLDPNHTYTFEGYYYTGMWVYDAGPPTYSPWSLFASRINATTQTNLKGKLSARMWKAGTGAATSSNPWQLTLYSYDREGRLADKWIWTGNKSAWNTHITYAYNRQGELTKRGIIVDSEELWHFYDYNQRGLPSAMFANTADIKPPVPEVSYTYRAAGAVASIDYKGTNKDATYGYTIRGWVESINNINSPGGNFAAAYDYFDNGNVQKAQFYNPQISLPSAHRHYHWNISYDAVNRLTAASYGTGSAKSSTRYDVTGITYDDAGNLLSLKRDNENGILTDNLTYNYASGTNRLSSVTDGVNSSGAGWDAEDATFSYDENGNIKSQSGKFSAITYNYKNLPTHFTTTSGPNANALYDANGQRVLKELTNGDYEFYVKDGAATLAVIDRSGFSHFNFTGPGGRIFGRYSPGTVARYYLTDHLGSTRLVTDQNNAILATFDYYPFGLLMPGRYTTNNNTIEKFTGKELDSRLNLYYFGARYLDPAIGRWLSVDPLLQKHPEWSPYNYALDNPFYFVDPDGKQIGFTAFDMGLRQGFKRSVLSSLQGAKNLVTDPIGTARGMANAVIHYKQTYAALKAGLGKRWDMATSGNPYLMGQVAGEGVALAGGILLTKGAGALAKNGVRLMKGVDNVADVTKARKLYSEATFKAFQKQLQQHGKSSLLKSHSAIQKRLNQHLKKLDEVKKAGGHTSSIQREIKTFKSQLKAIDNLLNE